MPFGDRRNVMAAGETWMADDGHGELATAAIERALDPRPLLLVDGAQDARIDRDQREIRGLQFEERRPLAAGIDAVEPRSRSAWDRSWSMRRALVLVRPRSASTRAAMAARAAFGSRKLALKPSSASNQS